MRLTKISVENFRLLTDVSVTLDAEKASTVLVGANNSGKTSMVEALNLFVAGVGKAFSISDFSVVTHAAFEAFGNWALKDKNDEDAEGAEAERAPALPAMAMTLEFIYQETAEDLAVVGDLLMDLDDQAFAIAVRVEFGVKDASQLAVDYREHYAKEPVAFLDFLAAQLDQFWPWRAA